MSTRKDKFSKKDRYFMKVAINLAKSHIGLTGTNPSVGCVVVKKNEIVSFGVTDINGRPHAETIALNKNIKKVSGSTVYLTLEPCSHYGKTPPCTNALIKSKVKKVIYSVEDHDDRTFNKSKKILRSKKILTKSGLLKNETKKIYKTYNFIKKNNFPYVTGKIATSSDLKIARGNFQITNDYSKNVTHQLRYKNQGILTSYKTVNSDNPQLNCRLNGLEHLSPTKIVIDRDLKINLNSYILTNNSKKKTIIFHNSKNKKKINILKKMKIKLVYFKVENDNYFDLKKVLKKIHGIGVHNILVECGKSLTQKMITQNLFNEFYFFKSNKVLNFRYKIDVLDIKKNLNSRFKNRKFVNTYLDKNTLTHYY